MANTKESEGNIEKTIEQNIFYSRVFPRSS